MQKLHSKVTKVAQSASERIVRARQPLCSSGELDSAHEPENDDAEVVQGFLVPRETREAEQIFKSFELEELQQRLLAKQNVAVLLQEQLDAKSAELLESEKRAGELTRKVSQALDATHEACAPGAERCASPATSAASPMKVSQALDATHEACAPGAERCASTATSAASPMKDVLAHLKKLKSSLRAEVDRLSHISPDSTPETLPCVDSERRVWVCIDCGESNRSSRMECNNCSDAEDETDSAHRDNALDSKHSGGDGFCDRDDVHASLHIEPEDIAEVAVPTQFDMDRLALDCQHTEGESTLSCESGDVLGAMVEYWTCQSCGEENRKSRSQCNNCGQAQDFTMDNAANTVTPSSCGSACHDASNTERPGDGCDTTYEVDIDSPGSNLIAEYWICRHCGEENRTSRSACNNCMHLRFDEVRTDPVAEAPFLEKAVTSETGRTYPFSFGESTPPSEKAVASEDPVAETAQPEAPQAPEAKDCRSLKGRCWKFPTTLMLEQGDMDSVHGSGSNVYGEFTVTGSGTLSGLLELTATNEHGTYRFEMAWHEDKQTYLGTTLDHGYEGKKCHFAVQATIPYSDDYAAAISRALGHDYRPTDKMETAQGNTITGKDLTELGELSGDALKSVFPIKVKANSAVVWPCAGCDSRQVVLHIYDVSTDGRVQRVNEALRAVGARYGAFHAGVEVCGMEWCYGYVALGTGVSSCPPKSNAFHRYRESIVMGETTFESDEVAEIVRELQKEWIGIDYDLLSRNCCHFTDALCQRLEVGSIPAWVTELATAGATLVRTVNTATSVVQDAVGVAAERAAELDEKYNISRTVESMLTREINIDEKYWQEATETKIASAIMQFKAWTQWGSTAALQAKGTESRDTISHPGCQDELEQEI